MGEMLRQLSQDACCTVYFGNTSHIISLPDATQADCHAYLKEELAKRGITDLRNKDIQVEADGSFGLLLPDAKLRATSYRMTLKPGLEDASGSKADRQWRPTFHIRRFSGIGYFDVDHIFPEALGLQLEADEFNVCNSFERRSHYKLDDCPLEAPFFEHFREERCFIHFILDPAMEQSVREAQQAFLQDLRSCHMMLRVPTLAAGHELLLMTDESGAGMIGYVEREGIIKSLAMQEYKTFVDMLPPQMVLVFDLDQTIVHTPKPAEQHRLEAHQQSGRVIDIATQDAKFKKQLCAPRSHIRDFFCEIKDTHHVLYCTAGEHSYGVAVVKCLRDFMLKDGHLDNETQNWIRDSTAERRVVSSLSYTLANGFPQNKKFKSLRMLLKMAYLPELTERIVIILDDRPDVWMTPSDRSLATLCPVRPQQYVTSDSNEQTWLQRFGPVATAMHQLVFEQDAPTKPLHVVFGDLAKHNYQSMLLR